MATKLYPPNINGTIPAFAGTTLVVPFSLNKAVSKSEIAGFVMKIKTVQGSILLGTFKQTNSNMYDLDTKMQVSFYVGTLALNPGQYYKIQLAFLNSSGVEGYYSTVGVVKYTTTPFVEITGLANGAINNHLYSYTGLYSQEGTGKDTSEKLYSSRFKLYNANGIVVKDSGEILHNVTEDINSYEAYEIFELNMDLEESVSYYLQFSITTTNGYTASTPKYRIVQRKSIPPDINAILEASLSYDDGYIDLYLIGEKNSDGLEDLVIGSFVVCRAASNENYTWNKISEFTLQSQTPTRFLWRDYTIEQGVSYKYSIQQFNDYGLYSDRIESNEVLADFEDVFLYDGNVQLKIRYNPKVSSFKEDILESKTDTIGHKYPYIFRNGNVDYKEFPISGLISYQMDDNKLFLDIDSYTDITVARSELNGSQAAVKNYLKGDLVSQNIYIERQFKLAVLEWLNNGKEKLFKSPTEGNYIVRLMNISLSPTDSLGRMLHTFSCTAYEVAKYTYDELNNYNFITAINVAEPQMRWATVELAGHSDNLDSVLSNLRRYIEGGITVTFSEENYNRIISYDYSLRNLFTKTTTISSYKLLSDISQEKLNTISTILGISVDSEREFTATEYSKIYLIDSSLKEYFVSNVIVSNYILNSSGMTDSAITRLEEVIGKVTYVTGTINTHDVYSIFAVDMMPGTIIQLVSSNTGTGDVVEEIVIGATGSYQATFEEPVSAVIIPQVIVNDSVLITGLQGSITYSYISAAANLFELVRNIEIIDRPIQQWIGAQSKTYYDRILDQEVTTNNLIDIIQDEKINITEIFLMRFEKRPIQKLFIKNLYIKDEEEILEEDIPEGITFVLASSAEGENVLYPNKYFYKTIKQETVTDSLGNVSTRNVTAWKMETGNSLINRTYYVKKFDFYSDMDCQNKVDLIDLTMDSYYIYEICNGRFDYTYQNVRYEKDYVDSNFAHGYYVDSNGDQYNVSTGILLDGLSDNSNMIFYDSSTYSNKVYINGDEIDLTEIERYSVIDFKTPIESIVFDNGIICELSYQVSNTIYNLEYTNETVKSLKEVYENWVDRLHAHRLLLSLDSDKALALSKLNVLSDEYATTEEYYQNLKEVYISVLSHSLYSENNYNSISDYSTIEKIIISNIKSVYSNYIRQLTIALKNYEEANSNL